MIERLAEAWNRFWFHPVPPAGLVAARVIVALNTLWILLSRWQVPEVVAWPPEFWTSVDGFARVRFFIGLPLAAERALFVALHVALAAAVFGVRPRVACLVSGLLLYHFAPLEDIFISTAGPVFSGTTLPTLALVLLALAPASGPKAIASPDFGWPLRMLQVLVCLGYAFPGYAKLFHSGLAWMTVDNVRESLYLMATFGPDPPPLAAFVAARPLLCGFIAVATIPTELLFPLVLFSRIATRVLVPLMLIGHLLIIPIFGLFYFNLPTLLLFVDWAGLSRWLQGRREVLRRRRARGWRLRADEAAAPR